MERNVPRTALPDRFRMQQLRNRHRPPSDRGLWQLFRIEFRAFRVHHHTNRAKHALHQSILGRPMYPGRPSKALLAQTAHAMLETSLDTVG